MCSSKEGEKKGGYCWFYSTYTGKLMACHFLSLPLPPPFSLPISVLLNHMISQHIIGGEERLRFPNPQQLVHLFTPNLPANEAVSLHNSKCSKEKLCA